MTWLIADTFGMVYVNILNNRYKMGFNPVSCAILGCAPHIVYIFVKIIVKPLL